MKERFYSPVEAAERIGDSNYKKLGGSDQYEIRLEERIESHSRWTLPDERSPSCKLAVMPRALISSFIEEFLFSFCYTFHPGDRWNEIQGMPYYSGVDVTISTSVKRYLLKKRWHDVLAPVCDGSLSWRLRSDIVRLNISVLDVIDRRYGPHVEVQECGRRSVGS